MNKCIIPTALLTTLLLSNCTTISKFRNLGKSDQTALGHELAPAPLVAAKPLVNTQPKYQPTYKAPSPSNIQVIAPTPVNPTQPIISTGRTTHGLMEPAVTGLPNNQDLKESVNVTPVYKPAPLPKLGPIIPIEPLEQQLIPAPQSIKSVVAPISPVIPSLQDVMGSDPDDGFIPAPGN